MSKDFDQLPSTERFSSRVEDYARFRPGYPRELLPLLTDQVAFATGMSIADVGSGTGLLTLHFLRNGNLVLGVEPNLPMCAAAERSLAAYPRFTSIDGTAEATTLPTASVDGVVVAQAFHWFDGPKALAEFRRVLKPGGFIALIWNARNTAASALMADYECIVHTFGSDFARSGRELVSPDRLRELLGPELREFTLANHQDLDWPGLRGRLLSASYMPLAGQPGHEPMLAELRRAFDNHQQQGQVRLEYETRIYLLQTRPDPPDWSLK